MPGVRRHAEPGTQEPLRSRLRAAVNALDSGGIRTAVLDAVDLLGMDAVVADLLVPTLREVGEKWQAGELSVLHEHHCSQIVRDTLAELRHPPLGPDAPRVVLACPPRELHELPGHLFGAMLHARGVHPVLLGADTPWRSVAEARHLTRASAVVLTGVRRGSLARQVGPVRALARSGPVFVGGPAARGEGETAGGAVLLPDDWREACALVEAVTREPEPAVGAG